METESKNDETTNSPSTDNRSTTSDSSFDRYYHKTGYYLDHLSGQEPQFDIVVIEHNYCKPSHWRPEKSLAKPTKTLFMTQKPFNPPAFNIDAEIDIEKVDPDKTPHLPLIPEAEDCEKYAEELRSAGNKHSKIENLDDWEENVPRVGWTTEHLRLYTAVVKALHDLRLGKLALAGRKGEAVQRRLLVDKMARKVRRAMASVTWDLRLTHWLHATLLEHVPTPLLAVYLEILQTLRAKVPTLVDQMLSLSTYNRLGVPVSEELLQLLRKPWDPAAPSIIAHKPRKLPSDPVIITVPSSIGKHVGNNSRRHDYWVSLLSGLARVMPVNTAAQICGNTTVESLVDQILVLTRMKIDEVKTATPNRPIILFGWNSGAAIACQAAVMEGVAGVVCMGFPFYTLAGRRGQADDALLDIKCPVYFVIGQNSHISRQSDIEELRERLKVQTGLLVIGSADEKLRVSYGRKRIEHVTQNMVDRCILDEIGDFLGSILTQPQPVITSLVPPSTPLSNNLTPNKRGLLENNLTSPDMKKIKTENNISPGRAIKTPVTMGKSVTPKHVKFTSSSISSAVIKKQFIGEGKLSDKKITTKPIQSASGITVNVGKFASLGPTGPVKVGHDDMVKKSKPTVMTIPPKSIPSGITSLTSLLTATTVVKHSTSNIFVTTQQQTSTTTTEPSTTSSNITSTVLGADAAKSSFMTLLTSGTSSSKMVMVRSASSTPSTSTTTTAISTSNNIKSLRPLSPSSILDLPIIIANDGDHEQFKAITAPLQLSIPDDPSDNK